MEFICWDCAARVRTSFIWDPPPDARLRCMWCAIIASEPDPEERAALRHMLAEAGFIHGETRH